MESHFQMFDLGMLYVYSFHVIPFISKSYPGWLECNDDHDGLNIWDLFLTFWNILGWKSWIKYPVLTTANNAKSKRLEHIKWIWTQFINEYKIDKNDTEKCSICSMGTIHQHHFKLVDFPCAMTAMIDSQGRYNEVVNLYITGVHTHACTAFVL